MRITILTVGTRGDVQPFFALGKGLRAAGYNITIATHGEWARHVTSAGLSFARLEGSPVSYMYTEAGQSWIEGGAHRTPWHSFVRCFPVWRAR